MKRSDMLWILRDFWNRNSESYITPETVLELVEKHGMLAPSVKAKAIRGKDWRWGGGCTMRCNCNECNPNYPMNVWEKE